MASPFHTTTITSPPRRTRIGALYDARSRGAEAYFELATEFLARNQMQSPRAAKRKAAAAAAPKREAKVRFWPYA